MKQSYKLCFFSRIQNSPVRNSNPIKPENIFIITNIVQKERVEEQLPHIPKENINIVGTTNIKCNLLYGTQ